MGMGRHWALAIIILTSVLSFAQTVVSPLSTDGEVKATLDFSVNQFVSSRNAYFRDEVSENQGVLNARFQRSNRQGSWRSGLDLGIQQNLSYDDTYYYPRELYIENQFKKDRKIGVGRKLHKYSAIDELWNQGVFQPRFFDDKLDPASAGLFGIYFDRSTQSSSYTILLSPIFIPEFGPNSKVENNKIVSANPWFLPPPDRVNVLGESLDIQYRIRRPAEEDVLFHPGVVASYKHLWPQQTMRISAALKPLNQLLLGFQFYGDTSQEDVPAVITVYPRILYHTVVAVDFGGHMGKKREWGLSLLQDTPLEEENPEDWIAKDLGPATLISGQISQQIGDSELAHVYLGFLNVSGGDRPDRGSLAFDETLFERRYQYSQAIILGLSSPVATLLSRPLFFDSKLIFDRKQSGLIWSSQLQYKYDKQWSAYSNLDIMGLLDDGEREVADGFISDFRANDRFRLGVQYVF